MPPKGKSKAKAAAKEDAVEVKEKAEAEEKEPEKEETKADDVKQEEVKEQEGGKKEDKEEEKDKKEEEVKKEEEDKKEEKDEKEGGDKKESVKEEANKDEEKEDDGDKMDVDEDEDEKGDEKQEKKQRGRPKKRKTPEKPVPRPGSRHSTREKRPKADSAFAPEDFKNVEPRIKIIQGRGVKLGSIPSVKASIDKYQAGCDEMVMAHKLLFTARGRAAKKEMKQQILAFSGYLRALEKDETEETTEKEDEELERKMATKAYKLHIPQLKSLFEFFSVDKSAESGKPLDKEGLIDRLLDFLGAPDESYTLKPRRSKKAGGAKKGRKAGKKEDKEDEDEDEEMSDVDMGDNADVKDGEMPSDERLRKWVKAYVRCFNVDKATTKHAVEIASEKFGVDLKDKKKLIKEMLTEEM